jgi:putative ABC transport system substrate-binding protein
MRNSWTVDPLRFLAVTLTVLLLASSTDAATHPPDKPLRIGILDRTSAAVNAANIEAFRQGLRDLGYVEGRHFTIEYRSAEGDDQRFPILARQLVQSRVDLILTRGTPAALAAKNATATIPVVITGVGDPVGQRVVASLARPGGNVTGLSAAVTDIFPKRVQLLRELVPRATRLVVLLNMSNPALPAQWKEVDRAARMIGMEPRLLDVRRREDLEPAFDAAIRHHADAMMVGIDTLTQANQALIVDLAARRRLPAMYASAEFNGGLISYGTNYPEMYRRAARFADKVFRGANPAELPVEEPTAFELVIDVKAARQLGLTIPPVMRLRADRITEAGVPAPGGRPVEAP